MSGKLEDALPLLPRETAFSYASRLAAHYGCQSTEQFCLDFNIDLRKLTRADEHSVQTLADLTGADVNALRQWSMVVKGKTKTINQQLVYLGSTNRSRWKFCPCCVREDIAARPELTADLAIYARVEWQLDFIRICPTHKVRLLEYTMPKSKFEFGNFVLLMLSDLDSTELLEVEPSNFEKYIFSTLMGEERPVSGFDGFELCHIVSMSRAFGICMIGSHVPTNLLDDETTSRCESLGFDALFGGVESIDRAMKSMRQEHWAHNARHGALMRLNNVVNVIPDSQVKRAFLETIADSYFRHFPIKAGWQVLGVKCPREKIARSNTARLILDIPQSLWDAEMPMATWKVLDNPDPYHVLIDLDEARAHFEQFKPWHSFGWIADRLNMGNAEVHRIMSLGILNIKKLPRSDDGKIFFQEREIEDAIARSKILSRRAAAPKTFEKTGLLTVNAISGSFGIRLPELVALIETGAIDFWFDHDHTAKNTVGAIWVNRDQTLMAARGWQHVLTIAETARALNINKNAVRTLLENGIIDGIRSSRNCHGESYLVGAKTVAGFRGKYVSAKDLSQIRLDFGSPRSRDKPKPVFSHPAITIYRRSDFPIAA